jgi:hypothetical protein
MNGEMNLKLLAIQAKDRKDGFFMAFVPSEFFLDENQIAAALAELGIEPEQTLEIGGWKTTSHNVAVAFVPFPPPEIAELLEPSES